MNNYLRSYACVRNRISHLKRIRSEIARSVTEIVPPSPYLRPLGPPASPQDLSGAAEVVIRNARLFPSPSRSAAPVTIALKNRRIAYIGDDIAGLVDGGTTIIDAAGRSVAPGLCDGHMHLMPGAEHSRGCSVEDVRDPETLRARLQALVRKRPNDPVYYVYGLHYTETPLIPAAQARRMLDGIVRDKPLFVYAHDLHTGWANTKALEIAGLMRRMPPYPELLRELDLEKNVELDRDGYPSGELREPPVYFLVEEALRSRFPLTVEQKKSLLEEACQQLAARGLTSVHNMGLALPEEDIECLMLLLELEEEGRLPLRVHSSCSVVADEMMLEDVLRAAEVRDHLEGARRGELPLAELQRLLAEQMTSALQMRQAEKRLQEKGPLGVLNRLLGDFSHLITPEHLAQHDERRRRRAETATGKGLDPVGKVHCKAVKLFMDGVVEKDTAFRLDRRPLPGIPAFSRDELDLVVTLADRLGLQAAAHCIGNGAVNAMLNAIEGARTENAAIDRQRGERVRHRIEHIEMCNAFDIPRFRDLGVLASMQALHEREPMTLWHEKVPEIEWSTAFAWKELLAAGTTLIFGSDWPIVSCNSFEGMERATGRRPWSPGMAEQNLTLEQALTAFSTAAAEAEYNEQVKGKMQAGMVADLVLLSENLADYRGDVSKVAVVHTVSDGKVVYSAPGEGAK